MSALQPLEYAVPSAAATRPAWPPIAVAAMLVAGVNAGLVAVAYGDKSWGALGIAIMVGPIANAVLIGVLLVGTIAARRYTGRGRNGAAILFPIVAAAADFACIMAMPLHGC